MDILSFFRRRPKPMPELWCDIIVQSFLREEEQWNVYSDMTNRLKNGTKVLMMIHSPTAARVVTMFKDKSIFMLGLEIPASDQVIAFIHKKMKAYNDQQKYLERVRDEDLRKRDAAWEREQKQKAAKKKAKKAKKI